MADRPQRSQRRAQGCASEALPQDTAKTRPFPSNVPGDPTRQQAEPWEAWETRLCLWSLGAGIAALAVLGTLVNIFLL